MKKLILISLVCFINTLIAQRDSVKIVTPIYTVVYSEVLQQPKWISYTVQCPNGSYPRKGMDFYTNDSVKTSDGKDYEANVWDKGHCAPAADFNCDRDRLWQTFSYLNCVLQHEKLNRGAWRLLEAREREIAATQKVTVEIRMVFDSKSIKLPTGATVPSGFYKTIKYGNVVDMYYFANVAPSSTDYTIAKIKR